MNPHAARRVLMVSYWFPPAPGAGAQRVAGFARHLPELNWRPTILTAGEAGLAHDAVPSVIRVPDAAPPADALRDYDGPPTHRRGSDLLRWLFFPDRFIRWRRRAVLVGTELLNHEGFDVVLASFPPASAVVVALALARRFQLPFILDFRDRWIGPGGYEPRWPPLRRRHEELERQAVGAARAITTVSAALAADVAARLPVDPGRVHAIPNGWDAARCVALPAPAAPPAPRIVHVGSVSQRNRPDLFLAVLASQRASGRTLPCPIRFVGNLSPSYVRRLGLADCVETTGLVSPESAWRETCLAPVLLLLVGDYVGRWGHNVKAFEYLRSGRPILCLEETADSHDRRLLASIAPGRCVFGSLQHPDSIPDAMTRSLALADRLPFGMPDDSPGLARFERRVLAADLARVLDAVTQRETGGRSSP